jgi:4'-phosphopantetheinyl transferase
MHWLPTPLGQLAAKQTLAANELHVWWWPESLQPPAQARNLRTDAVLRTLLARYLPLEPSALRFGREPKGRPYLLHEGAPDFNLSDTRGGSVLAIAACGRVGIDIERCDRELPVARLASRWFTPDEAAALGALDAESARRAFLRLWTAKEASCKATGTGIYGRLAAWRFAVGDDDCTPAALVLPVDAGAAQRWRFLRLTPAPSHTVALACRDLVAAPRVFRVTDDA